MAQAEESVSVVRTIAAPPEKVFSAWIDGAQLERWLAPMARADGHAGGRFRLEVQTTDGAHVVTGTYRELVPARRLVMTWVYEGPMVPTGKAPTQVTVDRGLDPARRAPELPALVRALAPRPRAA